jgi:hypothetical protein
VSVRLRALSRSNDAICEAAAAEELVRGGSAIDAVLAGYFAAAGAYGGVLLGPVALLLGGVGSGDRAFDGRVRQPGRSAKRPRGSVAGVEPPRAARVGVPASVPALCVVLGYGASATLGRLVQPGVAQARAQGAERRAALLARVGEVGALAFKESDVAMALVRAFGTPNGGLVTPGDFTPPSGLDLAAVPMPDAPRPALMVPWAQEARSAFTRGVGVCAIDVNGLLAAVVFETRPDGANVEELELSAPLVASPTLRGVPRLAPGTALPASAPIWITRDAALSEVWCAPDAALPGESQARRFGVRRGASSRTVEAVDG